MKQRCLMRAGSLLLAAAMAVTVFPKAGGEVHAAEEEVGLPVFATADELKTFNTDDSDGVNPAKIQLGSMSHQFWIAGSQEGDLVLYAAQSMSSKKFSSGSQTYQEEWNCTYPDGAPEEVDGTHWGGSDARAETERLSTVYFNDTEESMMKKTTIYTNDTHNDKVYSTEDTMYLPYAKTSDPSYITVGANSPDDLNGGLKVDKNYWLKTGTSVTTRGPAVSSKTMTTIIDIKKGKLSEGSIGTKRSMVPAVTLDITKVNFASAIPAITKEGEQTAEEAMTLRYKDDSLGTATVSEDENTVTLSNVPSGTYLVAQGSDKTYAKEITSEQSVSASDMQMTSFADCKVWLEATTTTGERYSRAMLAETSAVQEDYTISADVNSHDFGTKNEGYGAYGIDDKVKVTITNNGNQEVTLKQPKGSNFEATMSTNKIMPGHTAVVRFSPKTGLTEGTYSETVKVETTEGTYVEIQLTFKVNQALKVSLFATKTEIIKGESSDLEAVAQGGSGSYTYKWKKWNVEDTSLKGNKVRVSPTQKTYYTVEVNDGIETKDASVMIQVSEAPTPDYTIIADSGTLNFDTKNEGYNPLPSQSVTVTNKGNTTVTLADVESEYFEATISEKEIAQGKGTTVSFRPKTGLEEGTYSEKVKIKTTQGTYAEVTISFKVNPELVVSLKASATRITEGEPVTLTASAQGGSGTYTYTWNDPAIEGNQQSEITVYPTFSVWYNVTISDGIEEKIADASITVYDKPYELIAPEEVSFTNTHVGFDTAAEEFTVKNTGTEEITNISAVLAGTNADSFTLENISGESSLASQEEMEFSVKPNTGLPAGSYTAEIQITGEEDISVKTAVTLTIEDHSYEEVVVEPSCTQKGYTEHTCTICQDSYRDNETEMLAHTFGEWQITKEPTETEEGEKVRTCSVCGGKETETIPKLNTDTDNPGTDTEKPGTGTDNSGTDTDKGKTQSDKENNKNGQNTKSPKTGDFTNIGAGFALFAASGGASGILLALKKKRRK